MKKQVVNLENKKVKDIDIDGDIFGIKIFPDIIHQYIRYQNAKSRQGTHKTKSLRGNGLLLLALFFAFRLPSFDAFDA